MMLTYQPLNVYTESYTEIQRNVTIHVLLGPVSNL